MIKIVIDDVIGGRMCPLRHTSSSPGPSRCGLSEGPEWCCGVYGKDCPFSKHDRIVMRRRIKGCVHLDGGRCGLEIANGDIHDPMCGVAASKAWSECEASEFDK